MSTLTRQQLRHADGRRLHLYGTPPRSLPTGAVASSARVLEQRFDVFTGEWVGLAAARNTRPVTTDGNGCPLCPGSLEVPFLYNLAVFENRFPSLVSFPPAVREDAWTSPSLGRCEVVLYTADHDAAMATLPPAQLARLFSTWRDRSDDLWSDPSLDYVLTFENRGEDVGATIGHPHGQIYAFGHLPPMVAAKAARLAQHRSTAGACLTCESIERELEGARIIRDSDAFIAYVPHAARWPYEVHVRAKEHGQRRLSDLSDAAAVEFVAALQEVAKRYDALWGFDLPYMMTIHEAPDVSADWHLHVEFQPPHRSRGRLKIRASVETSMGYFINDTLPETSAGALRRTSVDLASWRDVTIPAVLATEDIDLDLDSPQERTA